MIPFGSIARTVRTNHAVLGGDLVPQLRFGRTRPADSAHIDRKPVGVQRVELVKKTANSKHRWPIG
jgi:hypothetical protein